MFSPIIKHIYSKGRILASKSKGSNVLEQDIYKPKIKPVRKYYELLTSYQIDECNGNDPTIANVNFPSGTYSALDYTPVWTGHRFTGWYTTSSTPTTAVDASGTQIQISEYVVYNAINAYARWQLPTTVAFDATTNGGQMPSGWTAPYYYDGQPFGELPTPTKTDYVFVGWFTQNGNPINTTTHLDSSNTSLTARFKKAPTETRIDVTIDNASYNKFGIYSTVSRDQSVPTIVDWGDGTSDTISGNISQLVHTYASLGTYTVTINNTIRSIALSYSGSAWYSTNTKNRYIKMRVKSISHNISSFPDYAFYYCQKLTDVVFPLNSEFTTIPNYCFSYCTSLTYINIPSSVTTIGSYAFRGAVFDSIVIPETVTNIDTGAFTGCDNLRNIAIAPGSSLTLGNSIFSSCYFGNDLSGIGVIDLSTRPLSAISSNLMSMCTYLKDIRLPNTVKTIGMRSFRGCFDEPEAIGKIELPEGIETLGTGAFQVATYLKKVELPSTLQSIGNTAFSGCSCLTAINSYASTAPTTLSGSFGTSEASYTGRDTYLSGINKLNLPSENSGYDEDYWSSALLDPDKCGFTIGSLPDKSKTRAYYADGSMIEYDISGELMPGIIDTNNLVEVELGNTITSIGFDVENDIAVFDVCSTLKSIDIPSSVHTIGDYVFWQCGALTSVYLHDGLSSIGNSVFNECTALQAILIPKTVEKMGSTVFDTCTSLQSITIPASVSDIGTQTFLSCTSLNSAIILGKINLLTEGTFKDCTSLNYVYLPNELTGIGKGAFQNCSSLKKLELNDNISNIANGAFSGCTSLSYIICNSNTAPTVQSGTFGSNNTNYVGANTALSGTNTLIVPDGSTGYDTSYWSSILQDSTKCGFTKEEI